MARGVKGRIRVIVDFEEYDDGGSGAGSSLKRLPHPIDYTWVLVAGRST